MVYRLLLNYFRLKLIRIIFARLLSNKKINRSTQIMDFLSFIELIVTQYFSKKYANSAHNVKKSKNHSFKGASNRQRTIKLKKFDTDYYK